MFIALFPLRSWRAWQVAVLPLVCIILIGCEDQPPEKPEISAGTASHANSGLQSEELLQAWKTAGAEPGFMGGIDGGYGLLWFTPTKSGLDATPFVSAFHIEVWRAGMFKNLPGPTAPLGLHLQHSNIDDAGLSELLAFPQLAMLDVSGNPQVTDAGIKKLTALKQLTTLNVDHTSLPDAGLKELAGMPSLTALYLGGTEVSDAGLQPLTALEALRVLSLDNTGITDAGLKQASSFKQLTRLDLSSTKITDAGLKELAPLAKLEALYLDDTAITDAGVKALLGMGHLASLSLGGTKITDAGLHELESMKLKLLDLQRTAVTRAGIEDYLRAVPDCTIRK